MLELWPIALTAGAGLVAWGDVRRRIARAEQDIETKASREVVEQATAALNDRLGRIEDKLDRLMERP